MVKVVKWVRNFFVGLGTGFVATGVVLLFIDPDIGVPVIYLGTFSFLTATFVQIALNEYELRKMGL